MRRRAFAVSVVAILALGALLAPAGAGASASFGERFDNQVNKKLSKPGIINTASNPVHWTQLKGVPDVFADGADNGLTDINDCPPDSAIRVIHGDATVECVTTAAGDITGVTAGEGLTGGSTDGDAELAVDFTAVQDRVDGTCTSGQAISAISETGTVTCTTGGSLASGRLFDDGSKATTGAGTWTSAYVTDHYEITITGVSFSINSHMALITPIVCVGGGSAMYRVDATSQKVAVFFYKHDGTTAQCGFHFQIENL